MSLRFLLPRQVDQFLEWQWPAWMSWVISSVSTVLEAAIFNLIFFALLVPMFQDAVFDATLEACELHHIFEEEEERDLAYVVLCWRNVRSNILVLWSLLLVKVVLLILTAPLQLVPVLGNFVACYINGFPTAWSHRLHYDIELRGYKVSESYQHAKNNRWKYANFGAVAFALEIIPVLNIFFTWTNIVATGLWIADEYKIEKGLLKADDAYKSVHEIYTAVKIPSIGSSSSSDDESTPLLSHIDTTEEGTSTIP